MYGKIIFLKLISNFWIQLPWPIPQVFIFKTVKAGYETKHF